MSNSNPTYQAGNGLYVDPESMQGKLNLVLEATTARTCTQGDSNTIYVCNKGSGNQTYTLPSAARAGLVYTFVCDDAAGEILINPTGNDTFSIKASEGGANVTTATATGIKNTAATNVKGDRISVVSDGVSRWIAYEQSGIWATQ